MLARAVLVAAAAAGIASLAAPARAADLEATVCAQGVGATAPCASPFQSITSVSRVAYGTPQVAYASEFDVPPSEPLALYADASWIADDERIRLSRDALLGSSGHAIVTPPVVPDMAAGVSVQMRYRIDSSGGSLQDQSGMSVEFGAPFDRDGDRLDSSSNRAWHQSVTSGLAVSFSITRNPVVTLKLNGERVADDVPGEPFGDYFGDWHDLSIAIIGTRVTVAIDGTPVFNNVNLGPSFAIGSDWTWIVGSLSFLYRTWIDDLFVISDANCESRDALLFFESPFCATDPFVLLDAAQDTCLGERSCDLGAIAADVSDPCPSSPVDRDLRVRFTCTRVPPRVTGILPTIITNSMVLTVSGTDLGPAEDIVVEIGGVECPLLDASSTETVLCTVAMPDGVPNGEYSVAVVLPDSQLDVESTVLVSFIQQPILTQVLPSGGQGGAVVTVRGEAFGSDEDDLTIAIDGTASLCSKVEGTLSARGTEVVCLMPAAPVPDSFPQTVQLALSVSAIGAPATVSFEYVAAPVLDSVDPTVGRPLDVLHLAGTGFGADPSSVHVLVEGFECPVVGTVTDTSISCTAPAIVDGPAEVVVVLYEAVSSSPVIFTYQNTDPILFSLTPAGVVDQSVLSIEGVGFGNIPGAILVAIGPSGTCELVPGTLNAAGTRFDCTVDLVDIPDREQPLNVSVSVAGGLSNTQEVIFITPPVVTRVEPPGGIGGREITIFGLNFGDAVLVTIDDRECFVSSQGLGRVSCITPPGVPGQASLELSRLGVPASGVTLFEYVAEPQLSVVLPRGGPSNSTLMLSGSQLGPDTTVSIGGWPCLVTFRRADGTALWCRAENAPLMEAAPVVVSRYLEESIGTPETTFSVVEAPTIQEVAPRGGPATTRLTVIGTGFGTQADVVTVTVGETECLTLAAVLSDSSLLCIMAENTQPPGDYPVVVSRYGVPSEALAFELSQKPAVTLISPEAGQAGRRLTIVGRNFGADPEPIAVRLGSYRCGLVDNELSDTRAVCIVPLLPIAPGQSVLSLPVIVERFGVESEEPYQVFNFILEPTIQQIEPGAVLASASGDVMLTISGAQFGESLIEAPVVMIPGHPCPVLEVSSSRITCDLTRNSTHPINNRPGPLPVVVRLIGENDSPPYDLPFVLEPVILDVDPPGGFAGQVVNVLVDDLYIGADDEDSVAVLFGDQQAAVASIEPAADVGPHAFVVECVTPEILQGTGARPITVSLYGGAVQSAVVGTGDGDGDGDGDGLSGPSYAFLDAVPEIDFIHPEGGQAGDLVTIVGDRFVGDSAHVAVRIGIEAAPVVEVTDSTVLFVVPELETAGEKDLVVLLYGNTTSSSPVQFTYVKNFVFVHWDSPEGVIFAILFSVVIAASIALAVLVHVYRTATIISSASPVFLHLILLGCVMASIGLLAFVGKPTEDLCMVRMYFPTIAFVLIYGSIFARCYRIWKIFTNRKIQKLKIADKDLLLYIVLPLLVVELGIVTLWAASSPMRPSVRFGSPSVIVCSSNSRFPVTGLLFAMNLALALAGAVLSYRTRKAASSLLNEFKSVSFALYMLLIVSLLLTPITVVTAAFPRVFFVALALGVWILLVSILAVMFVLRFYVLFRGESLTLERPGSSAHGMTDDPGL